MKINFSRVLLGCLLVFYVSIIRAEEKHTPNFPELNGFIETRLGTRIDHDPNQQDTSIAELRLQLETEQDFEEVTFNLVMDLVYDSVLDIESPDLETGEGVIDLRQANMVFSPLDFMDIKLGRQILTWGTGDLLFINDLFAKDWSAFLIGRDVEYLKAPTDALKISLFHQAVNADIVYTPTFNPDRYIDGKRISFYDRTTNSRRGREAPLMVDLPNAAFEDDELSIRLYQTVNVYEAAIYYYDGFWKSPAGQNALTGNATFPALEVFGASLRGPIANGIGYIEVGYYQSEATAASDPLRRNSEYRYLLGYEQEVATELTLGAQFYLEYKLDYDQYLASLPVEVIADDQYRRVFTLRLTQLLMQQNLRLSFFNFYSPSDEDGYTRINISYKFTDELKAEGGLNFFYGQQAHTFYAQFEENSNLYTAVRYEF